jgi:hypothetical protein
MRTSFFVAVIITVHPWERNTPTLQGPFKCRSSVKWKAKTSVSVTNQQSSHGSQRVVIVHNQTSMKQKFNTCNYLVTVSGA